MNPQQDNFERLQRIIALKKHEQPPPGYFHGFSRQVVLRIKAGETGQAESLWQRWFAEVPWLSRLFEALEPRPALAGLAGVGVCGLLLAGVLVSEPAQSPMVVTAGATGVPLGVGVASLEPTFPQPVNLSDFSATNGMMNRQLRDSLFQQIGRPRAQLINSMAPAGL